MAHVTARYWLETGRTLDRLHADRLVAQLSWRGIRGFPRAEHPEHPEHPQHVEHPGVSARTPARRPDRARRATLRANARVRHVARAFG